MILAGYLKSLGFSNHKFKRLVWVKIWLKKHPRLIVQGKQRHTKLESFFIPTALFCISQLTTTQPHQKVNLSSLKTKYVCKYFTSSINKCNWNLKPKRSVYQRFTNLKWQIKICQNICPKHNQRTGSMLIARKRCLHY